MEDEPLVYLKRETIVLRTNTIAQTFMREGFLILLITLGVMEDVIMEHVAPT
jgi:hypothetical protein